MVSKTQIARGLHWSHRVSGLDKDIGPAEDNRSAKIEIQSHYYDQMAQNLTWICSRYYR